MQNPLARAGMLRVVATYATFERRALQRQANAKPPDETDTDVVERIAAGLALQVLNLTGGQHQPSLAARDGYE